VGSCNLNDECEINTTIEESNSKAVKGTAVSPIPRDGFKTMLKVSACAGLGFG